MPEIGLIHSGRLAESMDYSELLGLSGLEESQSFREGSFGLSFLATIC